MQQVSCIPDRLGLYADEEFVPLARNVYGNIFLTARTVQAKGLRERRRIKNSMRAVLEEINR